MDLVLIASSDDVIAVKNGFCFNCAESKLNTKILRVFPSSLSPKEYFEYRDEYKLKGYDVECVCE